MATQYLVLPYKLGKRNRIEAQQAQACRTEGDARRTGERMASRMEGVVVVRQSYDEDADFAEEPVVLDIHGRVPDEWSAAKAAGAKAAGVPT